MKHLRTAFLALALAATLWAAWHVVQWIDWEAWMRNRYPLK